LFLALGVTLWQIVPSGPHPRVSTTEKAPSNGELVEKVHPDPIKDQEKEKELAKQKEIEKETNRAASRIRAPPAPPRRRATTTTPGVPAHRRRQRRRNTSPRLTRAARRRPSAITFRWKPPLRRGAFPRTKTPHGATRSPRRNRPPPPQRPRAKRRGRRMPRPSTRGEGRAVVPGIEARAPGLLLLLRRRALSLIGSLRRQLWRKLCLRLPPTSRGPIQTRCGEVGGLLLACLRSDGVVRRLLLSISMS